MNKLVAGLGLLILSTSASAVDFFSPDEEFKSKVESLVASNASKIEYFKADHELVGIGVITKNYRKMVFYTNQNADYIVSGVLIDTNTVENLTAKYSEDLKIDLSGIKDQIGQLHAIEQGNANSEEDEIYAVIDVNCGYCHRLWEEIQSIYAANPDASVKVNWIPVGFLGKDSLNKAESIAGIKDNQAAFELLAQGMDRQSINASQEERLQGKNLLKASDEFMRKNQFGGVPLVISKVDGKWDMHTGKPPQTFFNRLKNKNKPLNDTNTAAE
ncbi:hypothetical protein GCM10025767_06690 [Thalassotalea piscium]